MNTVIGKISAIGVPFKKDGQDTQIMKLNHKRALYAYFEFTDPSLLKGFKEGDTVKVNYNLVDSNSRRIIVKSVEHDTIEAGVN